MGKMVTVFSNKGGVGKTFFSVNLATSLALSGKRVLLLDMDFQAVHDMARMLNLTPKHSLVNLLSDLQKSEDPQATISRYVQSHSSGLDFLPAFTHTKQIGHITAENIVPFFKKASQVYDFIICDAGKAFSETIVSVLDQSNLIALVATPDILAVYQIKWCLELLQSLHFPLRMIKLVLNRAESRGGVAWQEVRTALGCEIFSLIPSDGKVVGMALNRGVPVVVDSPKSRVAESFNKIVQDFKNDDLFFMAMEMTRAQRSGGADPGGEFWNKLGISEGPSSPAELYTVKEEDEVVALKKRIHEKLVSRLHVEDLTVEIMNDPRRSAELRSSAEKIISNLIAEEKGTIIDSHEERARLVREIIDEALGLGPLEELLRDPDITDIMVNRLSEIYIEKNGKLILTNKRFISTQHMRTTIDRIIAPLGRRIDESIPMVDARLPDGSRFNSIIPPLSLNGPTITIRKFGAERLGISEMLKKHHSLSQAMHDFLNACVIGRRNMIISGGTGAGKTTLLNIVSQFIPDNERIITIEDAAELRLKKSHWLRLESRPPNVEGRGAVGVRELFINSLRMRPDRIIVGECRGGEVLDMLQAMNTGHDGSLTTLHANSTRDVLVRMSSMILLAGIELPVRAINEMIASAVDVIVHVARFSDGTRKITGITEVVGLTEENQLDLRDVYLFQQRGINEDGKILGEYKPTGYIPHCFELFQTMGIQIDKSIFGK